jgi:dipeptidase E
MAADLTAIGGDLTRYAAVYIGGGNTFKLLKEFKESRFDKKLTDYLRSGGFVYGGSAGAIVLGKTIKPAGYFDENKVGLTDLTGLNMLGGWDVFCHYSERDGTYIRDYKNNLYLLYEESGLFLQGGNTTGIGKPYRCKTADARPL